MEVRLLGEVAVPGSPEVHGCLVVQLLPGRYDRVWVEIGVDDAGKFKSLGSISIPKGELVQLLKLLSV